MDAAIMSLGAAIHISGHSSLTRIGPRQHAKHRDHLRDSRIIVGLCASDKGISAPADRTGRPGLFPRGWRGC